MRRRWNGTNDDGRSTRGRRLVTLAQAVRRSRLALGHSKRRIRKKWRAWAFRDLIRQARVMSDRGTPL